MVISSIFIPSYLLKLLISGEWNENFSKLEWLICPHIMLLKSGLKVPIITISMWHCCIILTTWCVYKLIVLLFFQVGGDFLTTLFCANIVLHTERTVGQKLRELRLSRKKKQKFLYFNRKIFLSHTPWHFVWQNVFLIWNYKSLFKCLSLVTYQRLICSTYRDVSKGLSSSTLFLFNAIHKVA